MRLMSSCTTCWRSLPAATLLITRHFMLPTRMWLQIVALIMTGHWTPCDYWRYIIWHWTKRSVACNPSTEHRDSYSCGDTFHSRFYHLPTLLLLFTHQRITNWNTKRSRMLFKLTSMMSRVGSSLQCPRFERLSHALGKEVALCAFAWPKRLAPPSSSFFIITTQLVVLLHHPYLLHRNSSW